MPQDRVGAEAGFGVDAEVILRPYQLEAVNAAIEALKAGDTTLIVMPTGTGKTIVFAHVLAHFAGRRGLVLAHREELIRQAVEKIEQATDLKADVEMAEEQSYGGAFFEHSDVVVSTIQTQNSGRRLGKRMYKFDPKDFGLAVIDECHHAPAKSYQNVVDYYRTNPSLKVLGVTATPDRKDEKALGQVFGSVAYVYEIQDAIRDGWLVPIQQRVVAVDGLDFSEIRTTAGDLNGGELARVMEYEKNLHEIVGPTLELADGRKTLLFAASVAHAERLCEIFNRHVPGCARFVYAKTPKDERRELFRDYKSGKFQILCNVGIATEGFDEPGIEVIVMARPTKVRSLYAQMAGRGTRALPGVVDGPETAELRRAAIAASPKTHMEIIDFVGNAGRHKLKYATDILGGNYDDAVVARATENIREKKDAKAADVIDELATAERQLAEEMEAEKRRKVRARARFNSQTVNPFEVLDIKPCRERGWDTGRQPSEKQKALLERFGVPGADKLTFTEASQLIGRMITRRKRGLCTFKQARRLKIHGYLDADSYTFKQASDLMGELAANGWKRKEHAVA